MMTQYYKAQMAMNSHDWEGFFKCCNCNLYRIKRTNARLIRSLCIKGRNIR